jgi:hypothetical protein
MWAALLISAYMIVGEAQERVAPRAVNPRLATGCTLYASASGSDSNSGTSPTSPKTLQGAANAAMPGAVVCLKGGTYNRTSSFTPPRSGTASAWIKYKAYADAPVNFVWTGSSSYNFINLESGSSFPNGKKYLEFSGFNLDGKNMVRAGFFCRYGHHLRFTGNYIKNMGMLGIGSVNCDYLTSDHNLIYHNGYGRGWSSGISYNGVPFYDSYAGFHNIIANNIISGQYDGSDKHTDGKGIILDLSANRTSGIGNAHTPPALIINNVVYQNGGQCITLFTVSNAWVVNNTCYKNNLDVQVGSGRAGQIGTNASHDVWFINNISVSWKSTNSAYYSIGSSYNVRWYRNLYHVGGLSGFTSFAPMQFFKSDPLFVAPPDVHPTAERQYAAALPPDKLANGLRLRPGSPASNKGVDSATLPNVPAAIVTDLKKYIYKDIDGNSRTPRGSFDLGAYIHH